jgi:hypothetical protein
MLNLKVGSVETYVDIEEPTMTSPRSDAAHRYVGGRGMRGVEKIFLLLFFVKFIMFLVLPPIFIWFMVDKFSILPQPNEAFKRHN